MNWLEFDWDEGNGNKVLARASEEELREAFTDPDQIDRETYVAKGEKRWTFFAKTWGGRILFVVYTMREDKVRVISAREAEDDEKRIYRKG
ncbi:MAG: BrnT family toxin [Rubrobacteraceae bacterium]